MPPSSDQDTNNTPSGNSTTNKHNHKLSPGGVHITTKNGKKNGTAKDKDGGVLAAVTKNAAKLSNNKATTQPKFPSPKMDPVTSTSPASAVPSPLLDAITSASQPHSTAQNTSEWAKNVPAYSSSPSNLINLGESPPTLPSSYEDRPTNFGGWTAREQRIPNGHNPSASPPQGRRRPLSYQMDGPFQHSPDDQLSQMALYGRRTSMYSQQTRFPQPPLPHQAQAHFYGAPDANLLLSPPTPGLVPGENGFYCGFDSLPSQDPVKPAENVVITGYEGGLSINSVSKRGLDKIVNIDGLQGGVYNAKIIPWVPKDRKNNRDFPLIAAVVYGPVSTASDASSGEFAIASSEGNSARQGESARGSPRLPQSVQGNDASTVDQYQTSVEIYSLNTKKHITTLLSLQKTTLPISLHSPPLVPPSPDGCFSIRADAGNLIIASGMTGETWLFRQGEDSSGQLAFRCIGKVWTTVQQSLSANSPGSNGMVDGDWHSAEPMPNYQKQYKTPILSLNGRWLAYCPAAPTSQVTARAAIHGVTSTAKIPGLNAYAPPQLPPVNCAVDTPGGESMIGKIAQVATQEVIKGAAYVGKQGMQAWNNYWNKSSQQGGNSGHAYQTHGTMGQQFPPTHAITNPAPAVNKDPGLISIIDLESLSQHSSSTGSAPHPLATFKVPHGCSFLSFAPSGLALFTASSKGDIQFVWDLMRLQFVKSSFLKGGNPGAGLQGPHVRQLARFSRMTIARIVDVVWTRPHGERAAMVTEHGTVHVLDLPASAFTWPPPRRKLPATTPKDNNPTSSEASSTPLSAASVASSAVTSLWSVAQPLVRTRRSSSVVSNATAASVTAQAGHGTQAFAAGISRSVGAATGRMNEMRKFTNKQVRVQIPQSLVPPSQGCVRLSSGKHSDSILVVGGGIVRIYTIKSRRADRPADKQKPSRGARSVEFRLPSLPDHKLVTENLSNLHLDEDYDEIQDLRWNATQMSAPKAIQSGTDSSIPQAEIESNAPYQPFHTDRRVALHVISDESQMPSPSVSALLSPITSGGIKTTQIGKIKTSWAFGGRIKTVKLDVGPSPTTDDEYDAPFDHRALPSSAIERVLRIAESSEDIDQIVVTTRRRKGLSRIGATNGGDIDEEGFFEDDCEVLDFASQRV